jgi:hypothetical protein
MGPPHSIDKCRLVTNPQKVQDGRGQILRLDPPILRIPALAVA